MDNDGRNNQYCAACERWQVLEGGQLDGASIRHAGGTSTPTMTANTHAWVQSVLLSTTLVDANTKALAADTSSQLALSGVARLVRALQVRDCHDQNRRLNGSCCLQIRWQAQGSTGMARPPVMCADLARVDVTCAHDTVLKEADACHLTDMAGQHWQQRLTKRRPPR